MPAPQRQPDSEPIEAPREVAPRAATSTPEPALEKRGYVRKILAICLFLIVAWLEFYLVNLPATNIGKMDQFTPLKVNAVEEAVRLVNPSTGNAGFTATFQQQTESGSRSMLVNAFFDKAQLDEETIQRFAKLGETSPVDSAEISYITSSSHNAACTTRVDLMLPDDKQTLELSQPEVAASDRYRALEFDSNTSEQTVVLKSKGDFRTNDISPCKVNLSVGNWTVSTQGFIPVKIHVPAGSRFRLKWEASDVRSGSWPTVGAPVPLLTFGDGQQGFQAQTVAVVKGKINEPRLLASAKNATRPISVDSLLIGTNHLELSLSGTGKGLENGKPVMTIDLLSAMGKYPLLSGLLTALNLALLEWVRRSCFPPKKANSSA